MRKGNKRVVFVQPADKEGLAPKVFHEEDNRLSVYRAKSVVCADKIVRFLRMGETPPPCLYYRVLSRRFAD